MKGKMDLEVFFRVMSLKAWPLEKRGYMRRYADTRRKAESDIHPVMDCPEFGMGDSFQGLGWKT
jgi:hypothetical protein